MDEIQVLTQFVDMLRNEIPGAGIDAYTATKEALQIYLGAGGSRKITPARLKIAKEVAKACDANLAVVTQKPEGKGWTIPQRSLRPWSAERLRAFENKAFLDDSIEAGDLEEITILYALGLAEDYRYDGEYELAEICIENVQKMLNDPAFDSIEEKQNRYFSLALLFTKFGEYKRADSILANLSEEDQATIRTVISDKKNYAQAEEKDLVRIFTRNLARQHR